MARVDAAHQRVDVPGEQPTPASARGCGLRGHGWLRDPDDESQKPRELASLAALSRDVQAGALVTTKTREDQKQLALSLSGGASPARHRGAAVFERFNLHASEAIPAHYDAGRVDPPSTLRESSLRVRSRPVFACFPIRIARREAR